MNRRGTTGCSSFDCWTQVQREITITLSVLVAVGVIIVVIWGFCYRDSRQKWIQAGPRDEETGHRNNRDENTTKRKHKKRHQRYKRKSSDRSAWLWGFILGCFLCRQRKKRKRKHRRIRSKTKSSKHTPSRKQAPETTVHLQSVRPAVTRSRFCDAPIELPRVRTKSTAAKEGTTSVKARKQLSFVPEIIVVPPTTPSTPIRPLSAVKSRKSRLNNPAKFLSSGDGRMETEHYRIRIRDFNGDKEHEDRERVRYSRKPRDPERGRARSPNPRFLTPSPSPPRHRRRSDRKKQKKEKTRDKSPNKFAKWGTMFVLLAELLICWLEPKEGWSGVAKKRREHEESSSPESSRRQRHRARGNIDSDSYDSEDIAYANRLRTVEEGRSDRDESTRATVGRRSGGRTRRH